MDKSGCNSRKTTAQPNALSKTDSLDSRCSFLYEYLHIEYSYCLFWFIVYLGRHTTPNCSVHDAFAEKACFVHTIAIVIHICRTNLNEQMCSFARLSFSVVFGRHKDLIVRVRVASTRSADV